MELPPLVAVVEAAIRGQPGINTKRKRRKKKELRQWPKQQER